MLCETRRQLQVHMCVILMKSPSLTVPRCRSPDYSSLIAKWSKRLGMYAKVKIWVEKWRESEQVCVGLDCSVAEELKTFLICL